MLSRISRIVLRDCPSVRAIPEYLHKRWRKHELGHGASAGFGRLLARRFGDDAQNVLFLVLGGEVREVPAEEVEADDILRYLGLGVALGALLAEQGRDP